jgi:hypothetical protein
MKPFVLFGLLFLTIGLSAQLESPFQYGSQFLRMGNAGSAMSTHSSILYNPAGIADLESMSFSVDGGQLYNNSGLLHFHAAAVLPSKKLGTFGVRIQRYGLEGFNYQNYSLTYAKSLFVNLKLAVTFNLYQFQIDNYGNTFVPNMEIGFLSNLSDNLSLGVHVANPFPIKITETTDFPTVFTAGASYKVSEVVTINADIEKNITQRENIKFGFSYQLHSSFAISAGINTFPGTFYFGIALKLNTLEINLGNGYDQILGNSTGLGIIYRIVK